MRITFPDGTVVEVSIVPDPTPKDLEILKKYLDVYKETLCTNLD